MSERLEDRALLTFVFVLNGGVLTGIDATIGGSNDTLSISHSGNTYTITDSLLALDASAIADSIGNGTSTVTIPDTGIKGISFSTLDGNDSVTVASAMPSGLTSGFTITTGDGTDQTTISGGINTGTGAISVTADTVTLNVNGDLLTTGGGSVTLTAAQNILLNSGASVSTEDGGITLSANAAGTTTGAFIGIEANNALIQTTGTGAVELTGKAGTTGTQRGVRLRGGTDVLSTATTNGGTITISGTAFSSDSQNFGVMLDGSGTLVDSKSGAIQITGQGGAGATSHGVFLTDGVDITSSQEAVGAASIAVNGTGGSGSNSTGIAITATGTTITSSHGNVTVTGMGGSTSGNGIAMTAQATIESTGPATVTVDAIATGGKDSLSVDSAFIGDATGMGQVSILADTIGMTGSTLIDGQGPLVFRPKTASTTIGIGGGLGTLNLSDSELLLLSDGFSQITIGDADSGTGAVDIDSSMFNDNVEFVGGTVGVTQLNAGSNNVSITARTANIFDGGDVGTDITGGTISLMTQVGGFIGSNGNSVSLSGSFLTTDTSTSNGDQYLSAVGTITWNDSTAGGGSIELDGGTFVVPAGKSIPGVEVNSGATLAGVGTVNGGIAIANGGTVSPGLSPGILNATDLSLANTSSTVIEVDGVAGAGVDPNGHDQINLTANAILNGTLTVDVSDITSGEVTVGDSFVIIQAGGTVTGVFSNFADGDTVASLIGGDLINLVIDYQSDKVVLGAISANTAPNVVTNTGLTITEGTVATVIGQAQLETTDPEQVAAALTYTLDSVPVNGTFYIDANGNDQPDGAAEILVASESFTQADINANRLKFDHDGSDNTSDSFQFDVSDGFSSVDNQAFNLTITPSGTEVTLTGSVLTVTDVNNGGDSNDALTISYAAGTYTITDTSGLILDASSVNGSTGSGTSSVTIPDSGVNGLTLNLLGGDDSVVVNSVQPSFSGNFTITAGTGVDSATVNGDIAATGSGAVTINVTRSILLNSGSSISVEDGSLTLNANSGAAAGDFVGIDLDDADLSSTGTGAISLTATGGNTAGDFGIDVRNGSTIIASGTGATAGGITLNGTAQAAGDDGVHVTGAGTVIRSTDGNVSLTGNSATTDGVQITVGALVESTGTTADAATVTIMGTGVQEGVEVSGANALVRSVRGNVDIDGINNGTTGNENIGVHVLAGGVIQSTGAGTVDVNGTGGSGAATGDGVRVSDANSAITSATGSILVTGQGGSGSSQFNRGVRVQAAGLISSTGTGATAATIAVMGTGGASGTDGNHGISVSGANSAITSIDGNIQLTGQGGTGSSEQHIGVVLLDGGLVRSTGTTADASDVTVSATGGTGSQNNFGVFVEGSSSQLVSSAGDLSITGSGGSGGNDNRGVNLTQDGTVITTTGAITVSGSASNGNSAGVRLSPTNGGRILSNGSGTITITANGNGTEADLQAGADSLIGDGVDAGATANAATGFITINADSIDWQASLEAESDGALTIQPRTASTTIGIGGGAGALNLTQAEINLLQDGFSSITIGSSNAGNVDVHDTTFTDPTTIIGNVISDSTNSPNITMNPTSLTVTLSGTVSPGESPGILNVTGNFSFTDGSTFLLEVGGTTPGNTITDHDQLAATGSVTIGTNVALSTVQFNGFVPAPGQEFVIISRVGGSGTFNTLGEGATISNFLGSAFDATITYAGGVGNDDVVLRIADPGVSGIDDVTFAENLVNATAQVIDANVTVVDADSADFDTGLLAIVYSVGGGVEDSLSVQNGGNITFNGANVSFSGVGVIATVNGGNNGAAGNSLIFDLNTSATVARVEELLENLTYANSSNTPAATRTISVTLNDGDGNTSSAETAVITVTPNSEAGSLTNLDPVTFLENTVNVAPQIIDANVTFVDADSTTFVNGGNLTVTYAAAGLAEDSLSINNEGNAAGQIGFDGANISFGGTNIGTLDVVSTGAGGVDLKVNLNGSATPMAVDALIQNLKYANSSNLPTATRTISVTVDDGAGGVSPAATAVITVTPEEEFYVVTTTTDVINALDGLISLREAVIAANTDGDVSNVSFAAAGTYTLTTAPGVENSLTGFDAAVGDLDILANNGNVTIDGTTVSGSVIIDGNGASRIFHVQAGGNPTFTIKGLVLQNGAELNAGNETSNGLGGAIRSGTNLVIEDSELRNNTSEGAGGAVDQSNAGTALTVRRSTFSGNTAFGSGGAINAERQVAVTIENSTFSANIANTNGDLTGNGGALATHLDNLTNVKIDSSTFTLNSARMGGAIAWRVFGAVGVNPTPVIRNTIIAQNTATVSGADLAEDIGAGAVFSPDYDFNIIGDGNGATNLTNGTDNNQVGTTAAPLNPNLQALAPNGGLTRTHAILSGSLAVDTGNSFSVTTDQRGETRPTDHPLVANGAGDQADIGAFEIPVFTFNITTVTCVELRFNTGSNLQEIIDPATSTVLASKSAASLGAVVVNGTDTTDDKLQINFTNLPTTIPIFFNGRQGPTNPTAGADELIFFNNTNTATTFDYSAGTVILDGQVVTYTGTESLANRGTSTTQNFNFTTGSETVSLEDVGTPMPGAPRPNAAGQSTRLNITGVTLPQTVFVNPASAGIVNLNLGGGADTVQLTNAVTSFAGSLSIDTGDPGDGDLTSLNLALTVGGRFSVVDSATVAVGAPLASTSSTANAVSISGGTVNLSDQVTAANSTVVIDATGSIVDGNGVAKNVVATSALLRATGGVGTAADPIETQVLNLAGAAAGTGFHVGNMGALEITTVDGTTGIAVSNGGVSVVNDAAITVSQNVSETNGGNITLTSEAVAAALPVTNRLYLADDGTNAVRVLDLGTNMVTNLVTGQTGVSDVAVDTTNGKIYWTDFTANALRRADLDGSNVENVVTGLITPRSVALDVAGGKVYWSDTGPNTDFDGGESIKRANLDGTGVETILNAAALGDDPFGISLDLVNGDIYWTQKRTSQVIRRADLDGGNVTNILAGSDGNTDLAVDGANGFIYFTTEGAGLIERIDLSGANRTTISTTSSTPRAIALDVAGGVLYFDDDSATGAIDSDSVTGGAGQTIITLAGANYRGMQFVSTVSASSTIDDLTIKANVTVSGGDGAITLNAGSGVLNDGGTVSAAGNGTVKVNSPDTTTLGAGSTVQTAGGAITFINDDIVINATATVNSGAGTTTIEPASNGQLVTLGSAANTLSLSDAELDRISAGVIHVGSATSGNLTVTENVSPGGTTTLHLETSGSVDDGAGNQTISVANLAVEATNAVTLEGANDVDTVAVSSTNGSVKFTDSGGFTVGTVDGVAGVDGGTGAVALTANTGGVTVSNTAAANDVNAGTTIAMTLSQDNQTLTIAAGANVESTGGKHVYTTDEMDIVGTITATGQDVALQPASAGEAIDLGSAGMDATNNTLELSNAELNAITAAVLRIGRDDASASGAILISMPISVVSPPAAATLHLVTGSTVTQNSAFSAKTLGISAGGAVTLNAMTNDVDVVAIRTTSGNVTFDDGDGFSVGSVTSCDPSGGTDTTNGVGTAAGNVSLTAGSGNVTVTNTASANDVEATGTITVTLMADDALLTINAGADFESTGGTHKYTADKMDLAGTITATGQIVVLAPNESGEAVDSGSTTNAAADTLELSSAELANVSASILRVGSATTGAIIVSSNVTTGAATLSLINNAGISGAGGITETNLAIQSPGVVNLSTGTHNVGTLAASITGANNAFSFNENGALTIGTADGITGLTTNDGTATIVAGGLLTIDDDVNTGTGNFVIDTAGAGQNAGDTITAAGFSLMGTGTFTLGEGNDVDTIAASVTGSITFNDVDTLTVGTVGTKVGITTGGNNLALTTAQQLTIGSGAGQDINVGAANVALTATAGGVTENAGSIITAAQLALSGTNAGNFSLGENNAVGLLAASINGALGFVTTTTLEVGTSNSISGVTTASNAATVQSTGSMTLTQAINTGTAATTLTSTTGGIIDNNGAATNVTASSLSATAAVGIGSGNSLETTVSTLAATNSTSGNIEITNTGAAPLTIGTIGTVVGISNSAAGGSISVTNVGAININQNVTADGDIFIKADESAPAATGDDLTIAATVTISSANGNIRLEAGDNVTVTAGSTISAPNGTVTIKGDCNNNDTPGSTIIVNGTVTSGSGLTVNGDTDGDSITLGALGTGGATLDGGAGDDTYNVNFPAGSTFGSAISFSDSGGTDTLNVNGSSDAETFVVRTTATLDTLTRTVPAPDEILTYGSGIDALNLTGGNANDLFDVQPSMLVPIDINANSPVFGDPGTPSGAPVGPGDELRFDPFGNPFNIIRKQRIVTTNLGAGGPFFDVTFRSIETFGLSPLGTDPGQRFDFDFPAVTNPSFTPITQTGYTSVRPDTLLSGGGGFGWDTAVSSTSAQNFSPIQGELFDLKVDGHTGTSVRRFSVNVTGNGFYSVNVLVGSYFYDLDDVFIRNADNGVTILSGIDVTFGHFTSQRFFVEVKDGSLDLEFGAGTGSSRWEISSVEFVPANNQTIAGAGGNFEADGVTVDSFTAVGADAGSVVTVSTDIGTITSADIDPTIDGIQHRADGAGNVAIMMRRPYHAGEALLSIEQVDGRRYGCILPVYTLPSTRRFDFNHGDSATQTPIVSLANPEGYLGVVETELLTTTTSYGWLTEPVSRRAFPVVTTGPLVDLRRDGHMGRGPLTFQTDLPNGTYVGLATLGSSRHTLDDLDVRVNGMVAATNLDILFGQSTQVPFVVTVTNGQIQVTVSDLGGELLWMIQGLEIRDQATDVTALTFINAPGNVTANGTTVTPITISTPGLADGTTVTVSSTLGTVTSADTVPEFTGTQLVVAGGQVTFNLRSPTTAGTPTLTVHTLNGDSFGQTTNAAYLNFLPPLLASVTVLNSDADLLTQNQAEAILLEAQAFWAGVPLTHAQSAALGSARLVITDLDSTEALGQADVANQRIWIDDNGSGLGWDVDGNLSVDSNRYDLLTTVAHELGHLLGLPDLHSHEDSGHLMSGILNPGETRMTTSASDAFFGSLSKSSDDADPTPFEREQRDGWNQQQRKLG